VRDGLENLNITEERLAELGMTDFTPPLKVTCADHEGDHAMRVQQWDGEKWSFVSDWITPMKDVVRPMIEASAAEYAKQNGIELRDCANGG
jgi:branched-chain amino acid transport system substrate-binding protein